MPRTQYLIKTKLDQLNEELPKEKKALSVREAIERTKDIVFCTPFTSLSIAVAIRALEILTHNSPTVRSITQAVSRKFNSKTFVEEEIEKMCKLGILLKIGNRVTINPEYLEG